MDRIRGSRIAYAVIAWGVVVALLIQVSLVGLWLFSGQPTLGIHREFGHAIFLGVLAYTGSLAPRMKFATALLSVITVFQTEVFALLPGSPLRAFHTVLPLVIFFLAAFVAHASSSFVRSQLEQPSLPRPIGGSRVS